jgi:predicted dehydrogenase
MGYGRDPGYQWRFDRRRANGVLGDAGSHMVDLARLLCGDISSVSARLDTFMERRGADGSPIEAANDSALLSVKFANGMTGMIHVSAMAYLADRVLEQRISLHGESGTLESELIFAGADARRELRGARSGEARIQPLAIPDEYWDGVDRSAASPAPAAGMFMRQPIGDRQFIDAIVEDRPASPSFYEAWKVQEILEAALESDRTGCTVSISADVGQR